nr:MAG TPA: hypothetical protein [Caudoviricetes sp.]
MGRYKTTLFFFKLPSSCPWPSALRQGGRHLPYGFRRIVAMFRRTCCVP